MTCWWNCHSSETLSRHRRAGEARPTDSESARGIPADVQTQRADQVLILRRLARRALALAGRAPWLAFLISRCGLAMGFSHLIHKRVIVSVRMMTRLYFQEDTSGREQRCSGATVAQSRGCLVSRLWVRTPHLRSSIDRASRGYDTPAMIAAS